MAGEERRGEVPSQALSGRCCSLIWCQSAVFCASAGENVYTFCGALIAVLSSIKNRVFSVGGVNACPRGAWPLTLELSDELSLRQIEEQ